MARFKQEDYEIDDFDFDNWAVFENGEGGFNQPKKTKARQVVEGLGAGFVSGVKRTITSANFQKQIIEKSLPKEYGDLYEDTRDIADEIGDLVDNAKRESEVVNDKLTKGIKPLVDKYGDKLPARARNPLRRWTSRVRPTQEWTTENKEELESVAALNDIFNKKQQTEALKSSQVQSIVQTGISKRNLLLTERLLHNQQRVVSYQEQIDAAWKKKTLELQYRQYFIQRKHLDVAEQTMSMTKAGLDIIAHNTALPDAVKIRTSEIGTKMITEAIFGKVINGFAGNNPTLLRQLLRNANNKTRRNIRGFGDNTARAIAQLAEMVNETADSTSSIDELGGSRERLAGEVVSDEGVSWLMNWLGPKFAEKIAPKLARNEKIAKYAKVISTGKKRFGRKLNTAARTGNTGNVFLDWLLEYTDAGSVVGRNQTRVQNNHEDMLEEQAYFDVLSRKSLTEIIPGFLSKIHYELRVLRTGDESFSPVVYDFKKGKFSDKKTVTKRLETDVFGRYNRQGLNSVHQELTNKLKLDKLPEPVRKEFLKTMSLHGVNGTDFTLQDIMDENGSSLNLSKRNRRRLVRHLKTLGIDPNNAAPDETFIDALKRSYEHTTNSPLKAQQAQADLDNALDRMVYAIRNPVGNLRRAAKRGELEVAENLGITTDDGNGNVDVDLEKFINKLMNSDIEDGEEWTDERDKNKKKTKADLAREEALKVLSERRRKLMEKLRGNSDGDSDNPNPQGFKKGGYTGDIGVNEKAGDVHGQEFVFDAKTVRNIGVQTLEKIRNRVNTTVDKLKSNNTQEKTTEPAVIESEEINDYKKKIKRTYKRAKKRNESISVVEHITDFLKEHGIPDTKATRTELTNLLTRKRFDNVDPMSPEDVEASNIVNDDESAPKAKRARHGLDKDGKGSQIVLQTLSTLFKLSKASGKAALYSAKPGLSGFKLLGWGTKKLLGMFTEVANFNHIVDGLWIKGEKNPRLTKAKIIAGEYINENKKVIEKPKDIVGKIYDTSGKEPMLVMTPWEYRGGLFDATGRLIYDPPGIIKKLASNLTFGATKLGIKSAGGLGRAGLWLAKKYVRVTTMPMTGLINWITKEKTGDVHVKAEIAQVVQAEKTNTILSSIENYMSGKKKFNDKDGDGDREGNATDLIKENAEKRRKAREERMVNMRNKVKEKLMKNKDGEDSLLAKGLGLGGKMFDGMKGIAGLAMRSIGPMLSAALPYIVGALAVGGMVGFQFLKDKQIQASGGKNGDGSVDATTDLMNKMGNPSFLDNTVGRMAVRTGITAFKYSPIALGGKAIGSTAQGLKDGVETAQLWMNRKGEKLREWTLEMIPNMNNKFASKVIGGFVGLFDKEAGDKISKFIKPDVPNPLFRFRMAQYGFKYWDKRGVEAILKFEEMLLSRTVLGSETRPATISNGVTIEEAAAYFNVSINDSNALSQWIAWFRDRFRPIYLSHVTVLNRVSKGNGGKLLEVDSLLGKKQKQEYMRKVDFIRKEKNPYDFTGNPFRGEQYTDVSGADEVKEVYEEQMKIIDAMPDDAKGQAELQERARQVEVKNMNSTHQNMDKIKPKGKKLTINEELNAVFDITNWQKDKDGKFGNRQLGIGNWSDKKLNEIPNPEKSTSKQGIINNTNGNVAKPVNVSDRDVKNIAKVVSGEVPANVSGKELQAQVAAITDTILNRVSADNYPNTVSGVINQKNQFTAVSAAGNINKVSDGDINPQVAAAVVAHLQNRANGKSSTVGGALNYVTPETLANATGTNKKEMQEVAQAGMASGLVIGTGSNALMFGTPQAAVDSQPNRTTVNVPTTIKGTNSADKNGDTTNMSTPVKNIIGGQGESTKGGRFSAMWDKLKSGATGAVSWIKDKVSAGGSWLKEKVETVSNGVSNMASAVGGAVSDFVGSVSNAVSNTVSIAKGVVEFAKTFTRGLRIGNLSEVQTAAIAANTASTESNFRMGIINSYGYAGLYQFGGSALADIGYMKKVGGGWRRENAAMRSASNWNNGLSLDKFLGSRELQDRAFVALCNKNIGYGRGMAGSNVGKFDQIISTLPGMAKYLKMAHLKGPSAAVKGLLFGRDARDGTGTSMIQYGQGAANAVSSIVAKLGGNNATQIPQSSNPNATANNPNGTGLGTAIRKNVPGGKTVMGFVDKMFNSSNTVATGVNVAKNTINTARGVAGGYSDSQLQSAPQRTDKAAGGTNDLSDIGNKIAAAAETLLGRCNFGHQFGRCARGVITILRVAGLSGLTPYRPRSTNNKDWPSAGIQLARDAGPMLVKLGYKEIAAGSAPRNGDIDVLGPNPKKGKNHAGHIQVFANGTWYSDHKQRRRYGTETYAWLRTYRISENAAAGGAGMAVGGSVGADGTSGGGATASQPNIVKVAKKLVYNDYSKLKIDNNAKGTPSNSLSNLMKSVNEKTEEIKAKAEADKNSKQSKTETDKKGVKTDTDKGKIKAAKTVADVKKDLVKTEKSDGKKAKNKVTSKTVDIKPKEVKSSLNKDIKKPVSSETEKTVKSKQTTKPNKPGDHVDKAVVKASDIVAGGRPDETAAKINQTVNEKLSQQTEHIEQLRKLEMQKKASQLLSEKIRQAEVDKTNADIQQSTALLRESLKVQQSMLNKLTSIDRYVQSISTAGINKNSVNGTENGSGQETQQKDKPKTSPNYSAKRPGSYEPMSMNK